MRKKKKSKIVGNIFFVIISGLVVFILIHSPNHPEPERIYVELAVKEGGKSYVLPFYDEYFVEKSIAKGETPTTLASIYVYAEKSDSLFVEAGEISDICNLLAGNYKIHNFKSRHFDGFVTINEDNTVYDIEYEEIGANFHSAVTLNRPDDNKEMKILWTRGQGAFSFKAIKNCIYKKYKYTPKGLKRGVTFEIIVAINLESLLQFYGNNLKFELDKERKILYIIR